MNYANFSAAKANGLFWLGRYTERVYICLHLLRRYHDLMIDGEGKGYEEYYQKLNVYNPYEDFESFKLGFMYDANNPSSMLSGIKDSNDNGLLLREEIKSETLAYIQLSLSVIREAAAKKADNITELQPITDYLLAFWGSIGERVFDERVRNMLSLGKLIENLDLHVRFDYPFDRIEEVYATLRDCVRIDPGCFDKMILEQLDKEMSESLYNAGDEEYKQKLLRYINHLILV